MKKVLVVEDNPNNMKLITYVLEKSGYEPIQAFTGEDGVELARTEHPDLILMDIQLPGIDGLEAVRRIRQNETEKDIPILAITSYAMSDDRKRILEAGCTGYFEKPINPLTIIADIEKIVGVTANENTGSRGQ